MKNKVADIYDSSVHGIDKKHIPELRFPEFANTGEWEMGRLGESYHVQGGYAFKSSDFQKDGIPIVRISNIPIDALCIELEGCVFAHCTQRMEQYTIQEGDLLIAMSGATTGKTAVYHYPQKAYLNQRVGLFVSCAQEKQHYAFLGQWAKSDNFYAQLDKILAAGAQPNISSSDIESMIWQYPKQKEEQQKIAECLSSIDEQILATQQKWDSLKEHKRGLMQKLFPANGKTTPDFRFPEFANAGEWEEKKLGKVFDRIVEKNIENNKNVLTISAQYGLINQLDFFNKSVSATDVTGYYLLHKGDFAYNKSRSQGKPVGAIKPLKLYEVGVVSTLYICFRCKEQHQIDFWEQYFDAGALDKSIMAIAQEGARNHGLLNISTNDFFDLSIMVPSPAEQKKIADCLSALDEMIAAQAQKAEALKEHKRGLMQRLFPNNNIDFKN